MPRVKSPYHWIADPLVEDVSLIERPMFGCDAFYLHGRLKLVLCPGKEEPWKGILIATSREFHDSLIADIPELSSHSVLGKWLYLPEKCDDFEEISEKIVGLILKDDIRIGVLPKAAKGDLN